MTTYTFRNPAAEREAKKRAKDLRGRKYRFDPVPIDARLPYIEKGQVVVLTQPTGCPRNGTMGQTYVADGETGAFLGMVSRNSLSPA